MSKYGVLAARLKKELTQIEKAVLAAVSQAKKAAVTGDADYLQAAALSLQNFYTGVERVFEEIAKQVDESLPLGASSHRELLDQMGLELSSMRPAVLQAVTLEELNEYRGFRHVAIHRYGFELQPNRIRELVDALPVCYGHFSADIQRFCNFLLTLDQSLWVTKHFQDFFSYVVDPEWLRSNDEEARALRQTQAGKPNKTWRVLHRVTYVERPALLGFGRDLRKLQASATEGSQHDQMLAKIARLEESNRTLEKKLDHILNHLQPKK
jgi:hypothetical protein